MPNSRAQVDARAKLPWALTESSPRIKDFFEGKDPNASFTLGYFAYNPSCAGRPDNTGRALLRYAARLDMHVPEVQAGGESERPVGHAGSALALFDR